VIGPFCSLGISVSFCLVLLKGRKGADPGMVYMFKGFRLDPSGRWLLSADGQPISLTSREFDTLLYLVAHRGELLDKNTLMQTIWPDTVVEENRLNQVISALRKALGERPGEHRFILTEPGRGYRFVAEVREPRDEPESVQSDTPPPDRSRRRILVLSGLVILVLGIGYFSLNYFNHPAGPKEKVVVVTPPDSIAVLPFVDLSPNKDQGYFADGVAEEVLNRLSRIRDLFVIGRQSSFSFKGKNEDLRVIGKKLGVSYLLEGSVRKEGKRVRITAQLVKAKDGHNLWSRSYERDLEGIFAIQNDIAKSVANALQITLGVGELGRIPGMTRNIAAYDALLKSLSMFHRLGRDNLSRCIEQLEKATALDPNFARAWGVLAVAYLWAANVFIAERADEYLAKSKSAAERAIAIAPGSKTALIMDVILQERSRNWSAMETDVNKLLRLLPFDVQANLNYGGFLTNVGRPHAAIEYLQRITRSEPLDKNYALTLGNAYEFSGNFKASRKEYKRGKSLEGDHTFLNFNISALAMETGDRDMLDTILKNRINDDFFPPDNRSLTSTMHSLLDAPEKARAELYRLYNDPKYNHIITRIAMAHWASYFNEPQLALKIYTELSESKKLPIVVIWRPLHKEMRELPGFKDLVTKLGLVDYWRTTGNWGEFCHPVGDDDFECH
jgi:TolB-like protein/DNA-binding winged helix-turn-helix (wHTH) protein/Tfp pilus assembly protein PilF